MKLKIWIRTAVAFAFCSLGWEDVFSQQPFYKDIQQFKKQDSSVSPPKKAIVFIGSSSFTMWKDVQEYFPSHTIINRGFGGSTLPDVIQYVGDIVYPYHPRQVVVYCGENDLAASDTVSSNTVTQRFITLFDLLRKEHKKLRIVYVSMKPSPSREKLFSKMQEANAEIKEFLSKKKRTAFVDVYPLMLNSAGNPRKELFLEDMLHMNKDGYAIWQKALEPKLK